MKLLRTMIWNIAAVIGIIHILILIIAATLTTLTVLRDLLHRKVKHIQFNKES